MANSSVVGILRALLTADSAEFETAMKRGAESAKILTRELKTTGQQMTSIGTAMTKAFTLPIVAAGAAVGKLAIDFESSFAGVRKTVDATEPEFQAMAESFRALSKEIPINVNEINRLGEAAGALGIPKGEIVEFAKVMAMLGVTTNVTSDQAAESIAKIQNIFGSAGKDTDRFAATLVELGNKGASTEKEILELANRIASAGNAVGLSQGQVLGFAAAIANVGIEAEAGGSAISRVFIDISQAVSKGGDDLRQFARVAGVTSREFAAAFREDAGDATRLFIEGLGRIKDAGGDLNKTLADLGFTEIRQSNLLRSLALSGDNLKTSLDLQATAWRENTALTEEARKRFETTESKLTLLWNRIKDVGITIGNALKPAIDLAISGVDRLIPMIEGLGQGFANLPPVVMVAVAGFAAILAAAGPILFMFGQLTLSLSAMTGAFAAQGLAMRALAGSSAFLLNPITLIVGALGLLGLAIYAVSTAETELEKTLRTNADGFKQQTKQLEDSLDVHDRLAGKQVLTKEETVKLDAATRELAKASGLSVDAFTQEERKSNDLTIALRDQLKARKDLLKEATEQAQKALLTVSAQLSDAQEQLNRVLTGKSLAVDVGGPGGAPNIRPMSARERLEEVERLNRAIGDLEKQVDKAREAYQRMAGTQREDIVLSQAGAGAKKPLIKTTVDLTDGTEKLTAAQKKAKKAEEDRQEAIKNLASSMDTLSATVQQGIIDDLNAGGAESDIAKKYGVTAQQINQVKDALDRQRDAAIEVGSIRVKLANDEERRSQEEMDRFFRDLDAEIQAEQDAAIAIGKARFDAQKEATRQSDEEMDQFFKDLDAKKKAEEQAWQDMQRALSRFAEGLRDMAVRLGGVHGALVDIAGQGVAAFASIRQSLRDVSSETATWVDHLNTGLAIQNTLTNIAIDIMHQASAGYRRERDGLLREIESLGGRAFTAREFSSEFATGFLPGFFRGGAEEGYLAALRAELERIARLVESTRKKMDFSEARDRMFEDTSGAFDRLLDLGGRLPDFMHGAIEQLVSMGRISQETADALSGIGHSPDWEDIQSQAEQYGVEIAHLGTAFQQSRINDMGQALGRFWQAAAVEGANLDGILEGISDEVLDVVRRAELAGVSVPRSLEPIIRRMSDLGLLTDEAGEAISFEDVEFNDTLEEQIGDLVGVIRDLLEALGLIPSAAYLANEELKKLYLPNPGHLPLPTPPPPPVPSFAGGTHGQYLNFGSGTAAMLHGREKIVTAGESGGGNHFTIIAWDGQSVESWLRRGGARQIAQGIAPVFPEALAPFGVTRR